MKFLKRKIALIATITAIGIANITPLSAKLLTTDDLAHLNPKTQMQVQKVDECLKYWKDVDTAYYLLSYYEGQVPQEYVQMWINEGYFGDYIDEIQAMGYSVSASSTPAPTPVEKPTPEPFTVEAYSPAKTMWATNNVNLRAGASTSYDKVGSLAKYDEVSVTGVASTGWYEVTREDGSKVYVSNNYLTEESPRDRVVYDYDASTDTMYEYTFTDTDPEVIDEAVENIEDGTVVETTEEAEETVEETTEEVATEETVVEEVIEEVEETVEEESTEEPAPVETFSENVKRAPYMLIGIGVCIIGAIAGVVMAFKKPKRKNRD